jgi:hypothetical protein
VEIDGFVAQHAHAEPCEEASRHPRRSRGAPSPDRSRDCRAWRESRARRAERRGGPIPAAPTSPRDD